MQKSLSIYYIRYMTFVNPGPGREICAGDEHRTHNLPYIASTGLSRRQHCDLGLDVFALIKGMQKVCSASGIFQ